MNTLMLTGLHHDGVSRFKYNFCNQSKRLKKAKVARKNTVFVESETIFDKKENEEKSCLPNMQPDDLVDHANNNDDKNVEVTVDENVTDSLQDGFSSSTMEAVSTEVSTPSTQHPLSSPHSSSLSTRILENDFGVPPSDFYRPFSYHDSLSTQESSLFSADDDPSGYYGDRGMELAMKMRKGGRMQSKGRSSGWKNSSTVCSCTRRRVHPNYFLPHQHCNDTSSTDNIYYDKLPTYCTLLSRPPLGIYRNVRILPSELELKGSAIEKEESLVFDKIPAYQRCFSNSTKYDKGSDYGGVGSEEDHGDGGGEEMRSDVRQCNCTDHSSMRSHIYGSKFRVRSRGCARNSFVDNFHNDTCNTCGGYNNHHPSTHPPNDLLCKIPKDTADENSRQRRTLYIGRIPSGLSSKQLRALFSRFGEVSQCSVHFRQLGDNYGFVTYARFEDAKQAIEKASGLEECSGWDVCFGGRRRFCKADYVDLDGSHQVREEYVGAGGGGGGSLSFNELLKQAINRH